MADFERVMKRLPEDVVEYNIFPQVPSDLPENEVKEYLEKQIDAILAHLSRQIVNYIWQHESFNLKPKTSKKEEIPPHLYGSTSFGDNIDDEWFIVSLLYEITREFSGTVIRVYDNDEEFLLIESADALPKWLDPETAENRVFIYNGDLHVIPIPQSSEEFAKFPVFTPTLTEAVACIRDCTSGTRCSQAVQDLINKRLSLFPRKIAENIHSVNCYLPTPLAVLLSNQPSLVSAGVRTFYYREPLELKACRPMKRFKPDDLVRTRVKMTRCLYAQLVQQQFTPDRRSGWTIVSPSNPEFLERDIGVKLAHGFEILCSRCSTTNAVIINGEHLDESNLRWQQFKKSLTGKGFFRGEIEGSKLYKKLLEDAKGFFQSQIKDSPGLDTESTGDLVLRHLMRLESTFEEFKKLERNLPPSDDDSWMNLTQEHVDKLLKNAGGMSSGSPSDAFELSKVAESMRAFVEHESGIDGAEFPKESADDGDGQFEGGGLIQAMQKIFDFPDEEDSSGSDMSEYDWSEGSDDELGSPTKMPSAMRKSNLSKSKTAKRNGSSIKSPKSVRFSNSSTVAPQREKLIPPPLPPRPPFHPPERPSNLSSTEAPQKNLPPRESNRPGVEPPPLPVRPPRHNAKLKSLSKPNVVVKPNAPPPPPPVPAEGKRDKKLEALMEAMDRELAGTEVGKSFERMPNQNKPRRPPPPANGPGRSTKTKFKAAERSIEDEDDDFRPVNIDLNVVKNTLESFKAQQGLPGPASNILAGFGIKLPDDKVNGSA
ncbi:unnamed protein product [Lymnaea stagnalis]|uniref:Uncharacterized protein n=1 Tax=Lymnaea stagnalis TaxID=6523 RepID=A0AAV2HFF1_LYMST